MEMVKSVSVYEKKSEDIQNCDKILSVRIVIPALNEEKNLEILLEELVSLGYSDVVVIDGKSVDQTIKVARKFGAKIFLQNGKGKGDAVRQVFNEIDGDFDVLILMDADGSMDPKEIPSFIEALVEGADLVKGSRFLGSGYSYDMCLLRRIGNKILISIVNFLCSTKYSDLCYGFLAFNRQSVEKFSLLINSPNFEIETEILIKAKKIGLKVVEVPSIEYHRKNGESKLVTFKDGPKIFQTIFREVMS